MCFERQAAGVDACWWSAHEMGWRGRLEQMQHGGVGGFARERYSREWHEASASTVAFWIAMPWVSVINWLSFGRACVECECGGFV